MNIPRSYERKGEEVDGNEVLKFRPRVEKLMVLDSVVRLAREYIPSTIPSLCNL